MMPRLEHSYTMAACSSSALGFSTPMQVNVWTGTMSALMLVVSVKLSGWVDESKFIA